MSSKIDVQEYENANDVSSFVRNFEFTLRLQKLTWNHDEPTPTRSNVPDERRSGHFNLYETKNKATGVPLSVLVNTKESIELNAFREEERNFLFRKEHYDIPSDDD